MNDLISTEEHFAFDLKLNRFHRMDRINQVIDRENFRNQKDFVENDQPVNDDNLVNHVTAT